MHKRMEMAELHKIQTDPGTQFSDGQDTKFVTNTQSEKTKFNKMLQARIQHSGLLKSFQDSRTPMEKMKIWKPVLRWTRYKVCYQHTIRKS